ncbi:hypothetical protein EDB92DRAFT_1857397 [Lactarius akahatsu]|uniref:Uncharacterized protein n=1 Tax=Lactarius akahatsu TaxID=416441 RepID=A0AAD4LHY7_9AGAM|nr:hypothetical protein EDB92DRAFT_1857397 [Lactarius akahatsu]
MFTRTVTVGGLQGLPIVCWGLSSSALFFSVFCFLIKSCDQMSLRPSCTWLGFLDLLDPSFKGLFDITAVGLFP